MPMQGEMAGGIPNRTYGSVGKFLVGQLTEPKNKDGEVRSHEELHNSANLTHPQEPCQTYPRCDHVPLIG